MLSITTYYSMQIFAVAVTVISVISFNIVIEAPVYLDRGGGTIIRVSGKGG